jgi:hypothetical protein
VTDLDDGRQGIAAVEQDLIAVLLGDRDTGTAPPLAALLATSTFAFALAKWANGLNTLFFT